MSEIEDSLVGFGPDSAIEQLEAKIVVQVLEECMVEVDRIPRMLDSTGLQVSAALLHCPLGQDGRM